MLKKVNEDLATSFEVKVKKRRRKKCVQHNPSETELRPAPVARPVLRPLVNRKEIKVDLNFRALQFEEDLELDVFL